MGTLDLLSTRNLEEFSIQERTSTQFEKYDLLLHGHLRNKREKILTVPFMKKYIELAKHFNPILNDDAARMIAEEYAKLRSDDAKESNVARVSNRSTVAKIEDFWCRGICMVAAVFHRRNQSRQER